jgi:mannose-1-phosphate guanylyltransferase
MSVYALVLAGGAGTRFWPASRARRPKQLLPLAGEAPLIVETISRVLHVVGGWEKVFIASGTAVAEPTRQILPELPERNLLVEPAPRNTAPCIAWAAATIARIDPDAVVIVLPSDHHIEEKDAFQKALETAVESARRGVITTIGLKPTRPETGFGYIEVADGTGPVREVVRFTEKPSREKAEEFVRGGRHLWNAGMFIFRAGDMLKAIADHLPELSEGLRVLDAAAEAGAEHEALAKVFPSLPSVSIDFGVMEKLDKLAVVPADIGWSDIGSWEAAAELTSKGDQGNTGPDGTVFIEARNNHVVDLRSPSAGHPKRVIALVGVSDLVVVETDDALLVVPRERSQDVKHVVDHLKSRGDTHLT